MSSIQLSLASAGLKIKAIKLSPKKPFQWASGYFMPIYNDNRMFLFHPEYRKLIADGFMEIIRNENIRCDVVAGTSTAGIPHGAILSDILQKPFIYIRETPKSHGMKNQIEGIDAEKNLDGQNIIVIEDLISTGGSSAKAVDAVRKAGGKVEYCLSIFSYGLEKAMNAFEELSEPCKVRSILTYDSLLEAALKAGYVGAEQLKTLQEWRLDPFGWGEKNGFPKVVKT